jgi:hypothetical protein
VLLVTADDFAGAAQPNLTVFRLPRPAPAQVTGGAGDPAQAVLGIVPLQTITWLLAEDLGCVDGQFLYHQDDTKVG